MDGVNKLLKSSGFPAMKPANGMSPLVRYIGTAPPANIDGQKVKERPFKDILLVRFLFPNGWLVASPDITENGEAGTIGANNFIKGDSATFTALALQRGGHGPPALLDDRAPSSHRVPPRAPAAPA